LNSEQLFKLKLNKISKILNIKFIGNGEKNILSISSYLFPHRSKITYISNAKYLSDFVIKNSGAILTTKEISKTIKGETNILISDNVQSDIAKLSKYFSTQSSLYGTHGNNLKDLSIGQNVKIGEQCNFGKNVHIEDNATIGNNVLLGHNVVIGANSIISNNVIIEHGSIIGSEGFGNYRNQHNEWVHIYHLGNVVIKDNVRIGSNCCIDRATFDSTIIEEGVIIDNLVHIAHNVTVGKNTAIAAKVGIAGSCNIGKRNMIGGMVGIIDHITTADDVIITATSTVIKNIKEPGVYSGVMPISKHAKWKRIAFWISKLDKIIRTNQLKIK